MMIVWIVRAVGNNIPPGRYHVNLASRTFVDTPNVSQKYIDSRLERATFRFSQSKYAPTGD
jgi:hypothetical protein